MRFIFVSGFIISRLKGDSGYNNGSYFTDIIIAGVKVNIINHPLQNRPGSQNLNFIVQVL